MTQYIGRCVAPPITENMVNSWSDTLSGFTGFQANKGLELLDIVKLAKITKLIPEELPSNIDLNQWQESFEETTGDFRDCLFHLMWYVRELKVNRHPG